MNVAGNNGSICSSFIFLSMIWHGENQVATTNSTLFGCLRVVFYTCFVSASPVSCFVNHLLANQLPFVKTGMERWRDWLAP